MSQTEQAPRWGMYDSIGDAMAGVLVAMAGIKVAEGDRAAVTAILQEGRKDIAEAGHGEIEDTVVREAIYQALEDQAIANDKIVDHAAMLEAIEAGLT